MANCFEDIIGIRGQCGPLETPSSGLWINDLPFINLKMADAVIGNDDDSGLSFLQNKINYAVNAVKAEINTLLSPYFRQNSILEQSLLGYYNEYDAALPLAANRRGFQIKIEEFPSLAFNITGIALHSSNYTGTVAIKVHDLITGQEIDSFDIDVVANQINYVAINKRYLTHGNRFNIFMSYDASAINAFSNSLTTIANSGCRTCARDGYKSGRYMVYNGAEVSTASSVINQNLTFTGIASGLSIQYNISCASDQFLCAMKDQLAWPILHKAGAEICKEVVNGTIRVNSITTIDREAAAALMTDFESEYKTSIKDLFHNLRLDGDVCFSCKQAIKTSIRTP